LNTDAVLSKKEIRKALKKIRKEKKTKIVWKYFVEVEINFRTENQSHNQLSL
jgi:hypothetical protein